MKALFLREYELLEQFVPHLLLHSQLRGRFREPKPAGEHGGDPSRRQMMTQVPQPRTKAEVVRLPSMYQATQFRAEAEAGRFRPTSTTLKPCEGSPVPLHIPLWKNLVNRPLAPDECISLIENIFSDHHETEAVKRLRGEDAQSFVDKTEEVFPSTLSML